MKYWLAMLALPCVFLKILGATVYPAGTVLANALCAVSALVLSDFFVLCVRVFYTHIFLRGVSLVYQCTPYRFAVAAADFCLR